MRVALITPAYPPGSDSDLARRSVDRVHERIDVGDIVHLIAPAMSRTPMRECRGPLQVHRAPAMSPIVTRMRQRIGFACQAARIACELHERGEIECVDAMNDPIAGAMLAALRGAGLPPIRIETGKQSARSSATPGIEAPTSLCHSIADARCDAPARLSAWRAARDAFALHNAKETARC